MSNDNLFNISDGYMLHCGIKAGVNRWEGEMGLIQDILPV